MARAFDVAVETEERNAQHGPAPRPDAAARHHLPEAVTAVDGAGLLPSVRPGTPGFDGFLARADGAQRARMLLHLQQTLGNRYVQRLIQRQRDLQRAATPSVQTPKAGGDRGTHDFATRIEAASRGGAPLAPEV